jgi:hypothetical protein
MRFGSGTRHRDWEPVLLGFVGGQYVLVDAEVGVVSATILEDVLIDGSC